MADTTPPVSPSRPKDPERSPSGRMLVDDAIFRQASRTSQVESPARAPGALRTLTCGDS